MTTVIVLVAVAWACGMAGTVFNMPTVNTAAVVVCAAAFVAAIHACGRSAS